MPKRCTRCGNFLADDERFCTRCGENVSNVIPVEAIQSVPAQPQYAQPQQNPFPDQQQYGYNAGTGYTAPQPGQNSYTYTAPAQQGLPYQQQEEMSLGKWVLTIIVTTFFSLISIIFCFVWGFGSGPETRRRFCKAMLIVKAIEIVLGIIAAFLWMGALGAIGVSLADYLEEYGNYGQYSFDGGQFASVLLGTFFGA